MPFRISRGIMHKFCVVLIGQSLSCTSKACRTSYGLGKQFFQLDNGINFIISECFAFTSAYILYILLLVLLSAIISLANTHFPHLSNNVSIQACKLNHKYMVRWKPYDIPPSNLQLLWFACSEHVLSSDPACSLCTSKALLSSPFTLLTTFLMIKKCMSLRLSIA